MKTVLAVAASVSLWMVCAIPAFADGNGAQTFTKTVKDGVISFPNTPPLCNSPAGTVTITYNGVFHFTVHSDGTFTDTMTATGNFVIVPTGSSQPAVSGHFEAWDDDHGVATAFQNGVPISGTDDVHSVLNIHGTNADGSAFDAHADFKATIDIATGNPLQIGFNKATC